MENKKIDFKKIGLVFMWVGIIYALINVIYFFTTINMYMGQGYPFGEVFVALWQTQLLPGLLNPIGIFVGVAYILFGVDAILAKDKKEETKVAEIKIAKSEEKPARKTAVAKEEKEKKPVKTTAKKTVAKKSTTKKEEL